jgi:hypothetical protein
MGSLVPMPMESSYAAASCRFPRPAGERLIEFDTSLKVSVTPSTSVRVGGP